MKKNDMYIIQASALPGVIVKTIEAKELLERGVCKTASEAAERVGVSRSAFYKYREMVFPFYEKTRGKTVTLAFGLQNEKGVLSSILKIGRAHV